MIKGIDNIFLAWRRGAGSRRIIVGIIEADDSNRVRFSYLSEGVKKAEEDGFSSYIDFPDTAKVYTENVLEIFGRRLNRSDRDDIQQYYDFWEVNDEYRTDQYYLLAHTQGLLVTDNFEFLAEYSPFNMTAFISEICSLSHRELPSDTLQEGDILEWKKDTGNNKDQYAVLVYKGDIELGYVKRVHSRVFYKEGGDQLRITVKSINKNGHLNRVFIRIFL